MVKQLCVAVVVLAMANEARAESGEKWDGSTVALQSVVGAGGMVAAGGLVVLATSKSCEGWGCYDFSPVLLAGIVGLAGSVAGVQLMGDALDGTGSLKGTVAGTGIGLAGGIASVVIVAKVSEDAPFAVALAAFTLPIVAGGVIGYHVSADDEPSATMRIPLFIGAF